MSNDFRKIPLLDKIKQDNKTPFIEVVPVKRSKSLTDFNKPILPVENQGMFPTCVAVSGKKVCEHHLNVTPLSAMWLYKKAQRMDEFSGENYDGTSIFGATNALKDAGICLEHLFPYNETSYKGELTYEATNDASTRKINNFLQVKNTIDDIVSIVTSKPLWVTIPVHEGFYYHTNGFIPNNYTSSYLSGYHAVLLTGYKTVDGVLYFILQNQWGTDYGDNGFCYMNADEFVSCVKSLYCVDGNSVTTTKEKSFLSNLLTTLSNLFRKLFRR
jgi:C1A family cysteine protease